MSSTTAPPSFSSKTDTRPPVSSARVPLGKKPDRTEFEALMRDNNQRLFRIARSIVKNDADAEDVVQLSYLCAYSRFHQLRDRKSWRAWLNRIVVNQALDRKRKDSTRETSWVDDDGREHLPAQNREPSPEQQALSREMRKLLERAIERLPTDLSAVLVMRDVEGMSSAEASEALGVEEGTVRVRLHRARALIRKWLGQQVEDHLPEAYAFAGERCDRIVLATWKRVSEPAFARRRRLAVFLLALGLALLCVVIVRRLL